VVRRRAYKTERLTRALASAINKTLRRESGNGFRDIGGGDRECFEGRGGHLLTPTEVQLGHRNDSGEEKVCRREAG